jgi:hypothetical protein
MKPLPTYPGMLTDMLESGEKICMLELKVKGKASNYMPFMHYLDTLEEFLMLFWKTILVTCSSSNTKQLFILLYNS